MLVGLRKSFVAYSKSQLQDNGFSRAFVLGDICHTTVSYHTSWQLSEYEELLSMEIVPVYKWYLSTKGQGLQEDVHCSSAKFRWLQK